MSYKHLSFIGYNGVVDQHFASYPRTISLRSYKFKIRLKINS